MIDRRKYCKDKGIRCATLLVNLWNCSLLTLKSQTIEFEPVTHSDKTIILDEYWNNSENKLLQNFHKACSS
jgi:hypothetical protein